MNLEKIKKEMVEVGLITLYFFTCFAIFMVLKKLLLLHYHITIYGWATTVIGALAIGKVVFIIDKLPIHGWLKKLKPLNEIICKSLVYTTIVLAVSILEKTAHYYLADADQETWSTHLFGDGKTALLLAHAIYIYLCFLVFYFFQFLDQTFGREAWFTKLMSPRN